MWYPFAFLLLLGVTLVALVRTVRRDPARHVPPSHRDDFAPRWGTAPGAPWAV